MIEVIKRMTAEQWLTNVILPIIVGIALLVIAVLASQILRWLKHIMEPLVEHIADWFFKIRRKVRRLFMSKQDRDSEDEWLRKMNEKFDRVRRSIMGHATERSAGLPHDDSEVSKKPS